MKYYAVIDTNILVSVIMSAHKGSAIDKLWEYFLNGTIVPMINDEIFSEYTEVLHRERFRFSQDVVDGVLSAISAKGERYDRTPGLSMPSDPDDVVFYEVSLSRDDGYLITGNLRHFPKSGRIVSPADLVQIIELSENSSSVLNDPDVGYLTERKREMIENEKRIIEKARRATEQIRAQAILNGTANMTLEEINEEIRLARQERGARREKAGA